MKVLDYWEFPRLTWDDRVGKHLTPAEMLDLEYFDREAYFKLVPQHIVSDFTGVWSEELTGLVDRVCQEILDHAHGVRSRAWAKVRKEEGSASSD